MLLVLLAFQRLQLLDHPFGAFTDRPHGMIVTPSSPDSAGRVYYGGDESHKIGLFKFRLGLFKFILPTFATDEDSWQVTNELSSFMRVPPPPNKQRKQRRKENFFLRLQQLDEEEDVNGGGEEANKEKTTPSSVAYMIIIPDLSKTPSGFNVISYHEKAKVLSASIAKAHKDSPYDYKLCALDLSNKELDSTSTDDDDNNTAIMAKTKQVQSLLNGDSFNIIHMLDKRVNNVSLSRLLEETETSPHPVIEVLKEHDIVVQLSINSFLLNPLDDIFDKLLQRGEHVEKSESKVDSYTLDYNQNEEQLFIFKTMSHDATISYLNSLECRLWQQANESGRYQRRRISQQQ